MSESFNTIYDQKEFKSLSIQAKRFLYATDVSKNITVRHLLTKLIPIMSTF